MVQEEREDRVSRWANIAKIATAIIALAALLLGGGFFYNEVWHVSDLRYTLLPSYDVKGVAFSGLVVENRGRVPARDVDIILADLEHEIQSLHMPDPHEKAEIKNWDLNNPANKATIEMERLSPGSSLSIYLLTIGPVTLAEGKTFTISSDQGKARPSPEAGWLGSNWPLVVILILLYFALQMWVISRKREMDREMDREMERKLERFRVEASVRMLEEIAKKKEPK